MSTFKKALTVLSGGVFDGAGNRVYSPANPPPGGSGGLTLTTVEIDCGTLAKDKVVSTVTVAGITATSKIIATQAGLAATGRQADENEMDQFIVVAVPLAGQIQFVLNSLHGTLLQGNVKLHYAIG